MRPPAFAGHELPGLWGAVPRVAKASRRRPVCGLTAAEPLELDGTAGTERGWEFRVHREGDELAVQRRPPDGRRAPVHRVTLVPRRAEDFGDVVGLPVDDLGIEPGREIEALVDSGTAVVGSPDEVAEGIERLYESSGGFGTLLVTGADWASRENARRSFERLARFVAPRFDGSLEGFEASRAWITDNRTRFVTQAVGAFQKAFTDAGVEAPRLPVPSASPRS